MVYRTWFKGTVRVEGVDPDSARFIDDFRMGYFFQLSDDRTQIEWDSAFIAANWGEDLKSLVACLVGSYGAAVEGCIEWWGEEEDDTGIVQFKTVSNGPGHKEALWRAHSIKEILTTSRMHWDELAEYTE